MVYYGTSFWAPTDSLSHYGIKGQKWGVRRWQNGDGSFNSAGKRRYFGNGSGEEYKKLAVAKSKSSSAKSDSKKRLSEAKKAYRVEKKNVADEYKKAKKEYKNSDEYKAARKEKIKKAAKTGAIIAGTALAAYGAYKLYSGYKNKQLAASEALRLEKLNKSRERGAELYAKLASEWANTPGVTSFMLNDSNVGYRLDYGKRW